MGGAASSLGGVGESYSKQVKDSNKFTDDVLTLFFTNANLKKLLTLHDLAECPKFVFTTSSELDTLFQHIKIEPKKGKAGEILFAPISDLSPAAPGMSSEKINAETQEKLHSRNELCTDISYFYIRIFQIYTALALTVIDAVPIRKQRYLSQGSRGSLGSKKPQNATLFGGGSQPPLSKSGKLKDIYANIIKTPFVALSGMSLLVPYPSDSSQVTLGNKQKIQIKGSGIVFQWPYTTRTSSVDNMEVEGVNEIKGKRENPIRIRMTADSANKIILTYTDLDTSKTVTQEFTKSDVLGDWKFNYDDKGRSAEPAEFFGEINTIYEESSNKEPPSSSAKSSGSKGGLNNFPEFKELRRIFQDKTDKGAEFPKAYCIARAMTLMNPVFDSERLNPNQPFISQICRNKFDFDVDDHMPHYRSNASSNMYIRSFVSLFYDDYKYNRATKEIDFTQTEPSRSKLHAVSALFAKLYNLPGDQTNFLEKGGSGSAQFSQFPVCGAKENTFLRLKNNKDGNALRELIKRECIDKMLAFQLEHTVKVNKLLMKMFKIEKVVTANTPQIKLRLQPNIKAEGKDGINKIGVEAHDLLLDYYIKSEGFYIHGVYLFDKNPQAFEFFSA